MAKFKWGQMCAWSVLIVMGSFTLLIIIGICVQEDVMNVPYDPLANSDQGTIGSSTKAYSEVPAVEPMPISNDEDIPIDDLVPPPKKEDCPACGGRGRNTTFVCPACSGWGNCRKCDGTGFLACRTCDGNGITYRVDISVFDNYDEAFQYSKRQLEMTISHLSRAQRNTIIKSSLQKNEAMKRLFEGTLDAR